VRLLHNHFADQVKLAYQSNATIEQLQTLLGRGRAKKGMFEGDMIEGELEIGQVAARFNSLMTAEQVINETIEQWKKCQSLVGEWKI
jgi:enoyl-[acyl-carrier protein] reductase II